MPGFVTHYFFGLSCYRHIPSEELKHAIRSNRTAYLLGLQGPDIFFYHLPLLRHHNHKNIGSYLHGHRTREFFSSAIGQIGSYHTLEERETALAYLCGFLCHYALDSRCHPYVYARAGYRAGSGENASIAGHADLEMVIDAKILDHYKHIPLSRFNVKKTFQFAPRELLTVTTFLSRSLYDTLKDLFGKSRYFVTPAFIRYILTESRLIIALLTDPKAKRKRLVRGVERFVLPYPLLSAKFITDVEIHIRDPLNLSHTAWSNPWDTGQVSCASFTDEYRKAMLFVHKLFTAIPYAHILNRTLTEKEKEQFLDLVGNLSYHSGLSV